MTLEELTPILIPIIFFTYLAIERLFPGREQPQVKGWWTRGLFFFAIAFALNGIVPMLVASAFGSWHGAGLTLLGTFGGALAVLAGSDIVAYWVHRTMHKTPWLWHWTHQMHHSAERMDMSGASYNDPFDFVLGPILPSTLVTIVLGVTPEAAAVGGLAGF